MLGVVAVVAATLVAALDSTIVGTVMPTVIGELGGIEQYAWVFSIYLLTLTVATPTGGRLADIVGRKPVFLVGLVVFVAASALCGLSQSMEQLIVFRALQGLGGGVFLPVGITVIGDLFEPRMRARVQGWFSVVWIAAALMGPAVGGLITEALSWRWAFYVNVPIGVVAALLIAFGLRETHVHREGRLDIPGALVLSSATIALLLAVSGTQTLFLLPLAALLGWLFVRIERRAPHPLIDLSLFRIPLIGSGLLVYAGVAVVLFSSQTYIPPFVQGVQGARPVEVGAMISAMSLGWSAGSIATGFLLPRFGTRRTLMFGSLWLLAGTGLLMLLVPETPIALPAAAAFACGIGIGLTAITIVVGAQSAVATSARGVVTSLSLFVQSLGAAVGVAVLGALLNLSLGDRATEAEVLLQRSVDPNTVPHDPSLIAVLALALHNVYVALFAISIVSALIAWRLTGAIPDHPQAVEDVPVTAVGGSAATR